MIFPPLTSHTGSQDLQIERINASRLREDAAFFKQVLEREKQRNAHLERNICAKQNRLDSARVFRTVQDVPGVDPSALIEQFSGAIVALKKEVVALRAGHAMHTRSQTLDTVGPRMRYASFCSTSPRMELGASTLSENVETVQVLAPEQIKDCLRAMASTEKSYACVLEALDSAILGQQVLECDRHTELCSRIITHSS
jgi:hypothetical protein